MWIKSQFVAQVKDTAGKLLNTTDWYIIRKAERAIEIPAEVALKRTQIVTESNRLEVGINGATTVEATDTSTFATKGFSIAMAIAL